MAIVLKQPDYARARPSTLLKTDKDYKRVFNARYPIALYFRCIDIMKEVESFLRSDEVLISTKEINNVKFHVAMFATLSLLNNMDPVPQQIADISIDTVDTEILKESFNQVNTIYRDMGADDQVAKGKEFVENLIEQIHSSIYTGRLTNSTLAL